MTVPHSPESPASVAVLVPTFGCRAWLPRAVASALRQTWPNVDVYVADDASGDVDDALISRFPDVTFLRTTERIGAFRIANILLALTDSHYVAFQDADDWS